MREKEIPLELERELIKMLSQLFKKDLSFYNLKENRETNPEYRRILREMYELFYSDGLKDSLYPKEDFGKEKKLFKLLCELFSKDSSITDEWEEAFDQKVFRKHRKLIERLSELFYKDSVKNPWDYEIEKQPDPREYEKMDRKSRRLREFLNEVIESSF